MANSDPAATVYAQWTGKTATELGFDFELRQVDKEELEDAIIDANQDDKVDGMMVYFPVFGDRQDQYLQQVVYVDNAAFSQFLNYINDFY